MTTISDVLPMLGLRISAGPMELRGISDDDLHDARRARGARHARAGADAVHVPWTDAPRAELPLRFAQYHWRTRAEFSPDAWVLNLGSGTTGS